MRALVFLLFLAMSSLSTAHARCAPFENSPTWTAEIESGSMESLFWDMQVSFDPVGPPLVWTCWPNVFTPEIQGPTRHCIEATWAELGANPLGNLGARIETIRKAADPIAAFAASYARHVTRASPRCDALLKGQ